MTRILDQIRAEPYALKGQARRYDNAYNEGAEGYNPHTRTIRALQAEYDARMEAESTSQYYARA